MGIFSSLYSGVTKAVSAATSAVTDAGSRVLKGATNAIGGALARTTLGAMANELAPTKIAVDPSPAAEPVGITGTIQGMFSKATLVANDLASKAKNHVMKEVAMAAFDTTFKEIQEHVSESVASLGAQLGQSATNTLESAVTEGSDAIDNTLGSVGKKFRDVLEGYKAKVEKKGKEENLTEAEKLGLNLATILHSKLSDLGDACFQAKKISLDAFKQQSTDAIKIARPAIEKELGQLFVNFLLAPIINFLQSIVSSITNSIFNFFGVNPEVAKAPAHQAAAAQKDQQMAEGITKQEPMAAEPKAEAFKEAAAFTI